MAFAPDEEVFDVFVFAREFFGDQRSARDVRRLREYTDTDAAAGESGGVEIRIHFADDIGFFFCGAKPFVDGVDVGLAAGHDKGLSDDIVYIEGVAGKGCERVVGAHEHRHFFGSHGKRIKQ